MNLHWKFWRRTRNESTTAAKSSAAQVAGWSPLFSAKELLGLQRVIGNQAVLSLLAARKRQLAPPVVQKNSLRNSFSHWRKARKD